LYGRGANYRLIQSMTRQRDNGHHHLYLPKSSFEILELKQNHVVDVFFISIGISNYNNKEEFNYKKRFFVDYFAFHYHHLSFHNLCSCLRASFILMEVFVLIIAVVRVPAAGAWTPVGFLLADCFALLASISSDLSSLYKTLSQPNDKTSETADMKVQVEGCIFGPGWYTARTMFLVISTIITYQLFHFF
ncbi:hypothetical protein ACJX0J_006426, partial [Zea mays]